MRYRRRAFVGLRADDVKAVSIERWYLSPYVEKTFKLKGNSFVPELRNRKCFYVSGFLCYLDARYEHSIYISHILVIYLAMLHMNIYI